jgi:hypothetical protein
MLLLLLLLMALLHTLLLLLLTLFHLVLLLLPWPLLHCNCYLNCCYQHCVLPQSEEMIGMMMIIERAKMKMNSECKAATRFRD